MRIYYLEGRYTAEITFDERLALKAAGWTWDAQARQWVTTDPQKVLQFGSTATETAKEALRRSSVVIDPMLLLSYAEDADIVIPAPPGEEYDPYQKAGIYYASLVRDTLIADQPGLGKTIEAIGLSNYLPEIRTVLIIVPGHATRNWEREWMKWDVKGLTVGRIVPLKRSKVRMIDGQKVLTAAGKPARDTWTEYPWPETQVVIISYDMLPAYEAMLRTHVWDLLVCDESQYLARQKNIRSRHVFGAAASIRKAKKKNENGEDEMKRKKLPKVDPILAHRRLFLSGTPILARPVDLWTMCEECDPNGLGRNWMHYVKTYCGAEEVFIGRHPITKLPRFRLDTNGASNLKQLQLKLRSTFMIRRMKASVLKMLPAKRRVPVILPNDSLLPLVEREQTAAMRVREALFAFEESQGINPVQEIDWTTFSEKLLEEFGSDPTEHYKQHIQHMHQKEKLAFEELARAREELAAAKLPMVVEYVRDKLATGEKAVVFCVHTAMAEGLLEAFPGAAFITGRIPSDKRQAQVDRFQTDPQCRLMIGNTIAAGTVYTMTAAWLTIHPELDWNATRVVQAEDRVHRRGQKNACISEHLLVDGTVDARVAEVFLEKLAIEEEALDVTALPEDPLERKMEMERETDEASRAFLGSSSE